MPSLRMIESGTRWLSLLMGLGIIVSGSYNLVDLPYTDLQQTLQK